MKKSQGFSPHRCPRPLGTRGVLWDCIRSCTNSRRYAAGRLRAARARWLACSYPKDWRLSSWDMRSSKARPSYTLAPVPCETTSSGWSWLGLFVRFLRTSFAVTALSIAAFGISTVDSPVISLNQNLPPRGRARVFLVSGLARAHRWALRSPFHSLARRRTSSPPGRLFATPS